MLSSQHHSSMVEKRPQYSVAYSVKAQSLQSSHKPCCRRNIGELTAPEATTQSTHADTKRQSGVEGHNILSTDRPRDCNCIQNTIGADFTKYLTYFKTKVNVLRIPSCWRPLVVEEELSSPENGAGTKTAPKGLCTPAASRADLPLLPEGLGHTKLDQRLEHTLIQNGLGRTASTKAGAHSSSRSIRLDCSNIRHEPKWLEPPWLRMRKRLGPDRLPSRINTHAHKIYLALPKPLVQL